ncbi:MAG: hypothetical protein A2157_13220 [Deltaproteobacteria bacterium RBG_16_47_11]|nr:MAG: hypothetical protein A2157_13220 [Deltaproteobacteria bacterium RBG_16_47_11]
MSFEKLCKYYLNSKCILEGGYCDLNCNQLFTHEDSEFFDKTNRLAEWRMEEEMGRVNSREKLR